MKRTYYGFQYGAPTFGGGMEYVSTRKPSCGYQVKCRANNTQEAREKLDSLWTDSCYQSLADAEETK
jgi:hypothetical protein